MPGPTAGRCRTWSDVTSSPTLISAALAPPRHRRNVAALSPSCPPPVPTPSCWRLVVSHLVNVPLLGLPPALSVWAFLGRRPPGGRDCPSAQMRGQCCWCHWGQGSDPGGVCQDSPLYTGHFSIYTTLFQTMQKPVSVYTSAGWLQAPWTGRPVVRY